MTFEIELSDEIIINNEVGNSGCWEQAVYPLRGDMLGDVAATFRLECDAPVLVSVEGEQSFPLPTTFCSERLIYLFNESERVTQVEALFTQNPFLILYTKIADYDVIYESVKRQKKLFIGRDNEKVNIDLIDTCKHNQ